MLSRAPRPPVSPPSDKETSRSGTTASGNGHKDRNLSRRSLLGAGAASGTAALTLLTRDAPTVSAAGDREEGAIPGTIERIVLPRTIHARK